MYSKIYRFTNFDKNAFIVISALTLMLSLGIDLNGKFYFLYNFYIVK